MNEDIMEKGLNISGDSVTCIPCYIFLGYHLAFVNNCFNVEKKVKEHCEAKGINGSIKIYLDSLNVVKTEECCYQVEDGGIKVEMKNRYFKEIKDEELDYDQLIAEQNDYCRFQGDDSFMDKKTQSDDVDTVFTEDASKVISHKHEHTDITHCILSNDKSNSVKSDSLSYHMLTNKSASKVPLYKCDLCPFLTKYRRNLEEHKPTHKAVLEVPLYKCETCSFLSKYRGNLRNHMLIHKSSSEIPLYKCEVCAYQTKFKRSLPRHMLIHKSDLEVPLYKCEMCPFQTKHKRSLQMHILTHKSVSEVPSYKCEICPFLTKYKRSLRNHVLAHKSRLARDFEGKSSKVPLYKCAICAYQTKLVKNLQMHMPIHRGASVTPLYKCELCGYHTKHKSSLRMHKVTHKSASEVPLYRCEMCHFQTKYRSLQMHKLTHCNM